MKSVREADIKALRGLSKAERFYLKQRAMWADSSIQGYYGLWLVLSVVTLILVNWLCESLFSEVNFLLPLFITICLTVPFTPLYLRFFVNPRLKRVLDGTVQMEDSDGK